MFVPHDRCVCGLNAAQGGDYGNREHFINNLVEKMN
jgi:hypothetical protein